jgi:hypothetical protein
MTFYQHRNQHRDANHKAIVAALTYHGCIVADLANAGGGVPDVLCGYRGVLFLVEIKTATGSLSKKQREFFDAWTEYPALVLRSADDVFDVMEVLRNAYAMDEVDWAALIPRGRRRQRAVDVGTGAGRRGGRRSGLSRSPDDFND